MALDRQTTAKLTKFATAFREARERGANESDTVMYLVKFFEEVLGYDALKGEISKELQIKDRFCDIGLKIEGSVRVLVEVKAASMKSLMDKHIEQAENYASRAGLTWVLLTNGIEWRLYHLTFNEGEGIAHDIAFHVNFADDLEKDSEGLWSKLELLSRASVKRGALEEFWSQKKVLSPASVIRVLFQEDVLMLIRRNLRRDGGAMLEVEDVFTAVRDVISNEALAEAGDLGIIRRRKKRRKTTRNDATEATPVPAEPATVTEPIQPDTVPAVVFPTAKPPGGAQA